MSKAINRFFFAMTTLFVVVFLWMALAKVDITTQAVGIVVPEKNITKLGTMVTGEIVAVIHSHPITAPVPSQADRVSCEDSGLPWHIVNPKTEEWGYLEPSGYKAPILGRQWVWGVTDCWSLVRDWYKETKDIELRDWERPLTHDEFVKNPMFESCAWRTGFRKLRSDEKLLDGDLLFMSICSRGLNHVAIFLNGDVLHHLTDRLSCREPYSEWLLKCTGGRYRYAS